jgi:hypothetical protein
MKRIVEYVFTSSVVVAIACALYAGRGWNATTALFPRAVGVPTLVLVIAILVVEVARGRRGEGGSGSLAAAEPDAAFGATARRMVRYFGWLLGFVLAVWAIGLSYAIAVYILAYLRVEGRYGWLKCVVYASVTAGLIAVVYSQVFRVAWPEGALLRSLNP